MNDFKIAKNKNTVFIKYKFKINEYELKKDCANGLLTIICLYRNQRPGER